MDPARERRPHLARRADDQDVTGQAAEAVDICRRRLGEDVFELFLVPDFLWQRSQKRNRIPNRTTRPTEKPSVLPTVSASSTAVLPFAGTPLIR